MIIIVVYFWGHHVYFWGFCVFGTTYLRLLLVTVVVTLEGVAGRVSVYVWIRLLITMIFSANYVVVL